MPSKKLIPVVVLDVANLKSLKNLKRTFPKLYNHLIKGKVKTAKGGKKFNKEFFKANTFIAYYNELSKLNRVEKIEDSVVDEEVIRFERMIRDEFGRAVRDCDDPHLFALLRLTNSKSVVSLDARMSRCRRCLRKSNINNNEFARVKTQSFC